MTTADQTPPSPTKRTGWNIAIGLLFVLLSMALIHLFLAVFSPKPYEPPTQPFLGYEPDAMQQSVQPDKIAAELDTILQMGNRFVGYPGFNQAADYIRQRYEAAGLRIIEQNIKVPAPYTEIAEVSTATADPLDFSIYPLLPNHLQPMTTGDGFVQGKLLRVTEEMLYERQSFDNCIALLDDATAPPVGYGYNWARYARLGFVAVIVSHSEGLDQINWPALNAMVSLAPVNYVRLVADPAVFDHVGEELRLKVRVRFRNTPVRTIVGILEGGQAETNEALVIPVSYDALSHLPDLSPGPFQAVNLALQLKLLDGFVKYRDSLRRDVIFCAFGARSMAGAAQNEFLRAIGANSDGARRMYAEKQLAENQHALKLMTEILALFDDPSFLQDAAASVTSVSQLPKEERAIFDKQYQYSLNTVVFELSEQMMYDKIIFEKGDTTDLETPEYQRYFNSKEIYERAFSSAGYPLVKLLERRPDFILDYRIRQRLLERFQELSDYHTEQVHFQTTNIELHGLMRGYRHFAAFAPELAPSEKEAEREVISFSMGWLSNQQDHEQVTKDVIMSSIARLRLKENASLWLADSPKTHANQIHGMVSGMQLLSRYWYTAQYPAFSIVNTDRSYREHASPVVLPWMTDISRLRHSAGVLAESLLSVAHGTGELNPVKQSGAGIADHFGTVYVSNVGQSIIPNYPLKGALVCDKGQTAALWAPKNGTFPGLMQFTNPYGRYDLTHCIGDFVESRWGFHPVAAGYASNGIINIIKDEGGPAQKIFKSTNLRASDISDAVNIVTFRCSPVTLLDLINPQTLQAYAGAEFIRRRGLTTFPSIYELRLGQDLISAFIKPDEYFYVKLKSGSIDNEMVQETRAFMLGVNLEELEEVSDDEHAPLRMGNEIRGDGYLAMETPFVRDVPNEVAKSMSFVNAQRLKLQQHYNMVDDRTVQFHQRAQELIEEATATQLPKHESIQLARGAVTYATLNHPVLRENISEAVIGIVFYLCLLVPFVFFFEKLIFGFTDIRKQLAAHVVTFLIVFLLLRILHPAFSMIRSSLMILLGFIILLIATGIIAMFSSKFKENLEAIRKQRGQVSEADVNKFGAIAIAFMLGLNNMHRRRVRTLLTCGTLILITFVIICFTSIRSNLVEKSQAVGRAPYQGFLARNEDYIPMQTPELSALQDEYNQQYTVVPRYMYVGIEEFENRERYYPQLEVVRKLDDRTRNAFANTLLRLGSQEPLARHLPLQGRWFTREQETDTSLTIPLLVSRKIASALSIDASTLENLGQEIDGEPFHGFEVTINGQNFLVQGVFLGADLDGLLDLDGRNLLPFDVKSVNQLNFHNSDQNYPIAPDDSPQIAGEDAIIMPLRDPGLTIQRGYERISSVAVVLPDDLPYSTTKKVIDSYMEQRGKETFYGLDKYSFSGMIARKRSFVGLLDMLVPLIIAAFTVLNTIRGSVFERREEIFVYNAVGIAPRHIFFIFFAESIVYAVVGSVLGYLLSQGTGRILTALDLTGGLNMSFTSIGTIYASVVIMVAVFLSTIFPAFAAKRIAAPSTDVGWHLPPPEVDVLRFNLPFTFNYSDRVGVLEFFRRFFVDHGEGSSGPFFAGKPEFGVFSDEDGDGYVPQLSVMVWLKPFDLGVSQRLIISLPTDSETGEYIANITLLRQSGTLDNWRRLNVQFVRLLRRQFLHWRAVRTEERLVMFEEARRRLSDTVLATGALQPPTASITSQPGGLDG